MKNLYKIIVLTLITLSSSLFTVAQTNVSGGIYSNTTWTLNNSPYIVVDTLVVFPGDTLTIEPGVVVKFANGKFLEIREATLIALGTSTDSITFTSNSNNPIPGIWRSIYFNSTLTNTASKFSYCNFYYAKYGLEKPNLDSAIIKNSNFMYNESGIGNNIPNAVYNISIDS